MPTVKEIVQEAMVRDEPAFHNARVAKFFADLDAAGYAIVPINPTDEMLAAAYGNHDDRAGSAGASVKEIRGRRTFFRRF